MKRLVLFFTITLFFGCTQATNTLEELQAEGELRVVTRWGLDTYYHTAQGVQGFEYDLVELFAKKIGVKVRYVMPDNFDFTIPFASQNKVHFAAAGLFVTTPKKRWVRFSQHYNQVTPQIVSLREKSGKKPESYWQDHPLNVVADTGGEDVLRFLNQNQALYRWKAHRNSSFEGLTAKIVRHELDHVVLPSNVVLLLQRFYPELAVTLDLASPQEVAWAFPHSTDDSLYQAANDFFLEIKQNGTLNSLLERYFGHIQNFNYVGSRRFMRDIEERLPKYRAFFEHSAKESGVDWYWLAAMGYQESHWDEKAVSPTGVRGIMMLTQVTAKEMGVKKRTKADQSIRGGALYFRKIKRRLPDEIAEPDRTWMALAAYNVGYGHLQDARKLTKKRGNNPHRWSDVKQTLPLLREKKWYKQTKYGYARGNEPVHYVTNIRSYYEVLIWYFQNKQEVVAKN